LLALLVLHILALRALLSLRRLAGGILLATLVLSALLRLALLVLSALALAALRGLAILPGWCSRTARRALILRSSATLSAPAAAGGLRRRYGDTCQQRSGRYQKLAPHGGRFLCCRPVRRCFGECQMRSCETGSLLH
jgi:hypothetical protein